MQRNMLAAAIAATLPQENPGVDALELARGAIRNELRRLITLVDDGRLAGIIVSERESAGSPNITVRGHGDQAILAQSAFHLISGKLGQP